MIFNNSRCVEPSCADNEYWNGHQCVMINCPPGSYYKDFKCVHEPTPQDQCGVQYYWNGKTCNYHQYQCPYGTNWDGSLCKPTGSCKQGYYQNNDGHCVAFPQACLPPTTWNGERCETHGTCPSGTYFSGGSCQNYVPCQNGHVWDSKHFTCNCPTGEQSNGYTCVQCSGGKHWIAGVGCRCPDGHFDLGSQC